MNQLLNHIIETANQAYPDEMVRGYADGERNLGDTLAQFIAAELQDTFDENASFENARQTAVDAIAKAVNELSDVMEALQKMSKPKEVSRVGSTRRRHTQTSRSNPHPGRRKGSR